MALSGLVPCPARIPGFQVLTRQGLVDFSGAAESLAV